MTKQVYDMSKKELLEMYYNDTATAQELFYIAKKVFSVPDETLLSMKRKFWGMIPDEKIPHIWQNKDFDPEVLKRTKDCSYNSTYDYHVGKYSDQQFSYLTSFFEPILSWIGYIAKAEKMQGNVVTMDCILARREAMANAEEKMKLQIKDAIKSR